MEREHLEMILEDINSKFDIILEGYDNLRRELRDLSLKTDERFDLVDFKFDVLNKKIDGVDDKLTSKIDEVAADIRDHRADTEVHRGYQIRED